MRTFSRQFLAATRAFLVLSVLLGLAWPFAFTGVAQVVAPRQANGSLVRTADGTVVGSSLLGQKAEGPQWFAARPSDSEYAGDTSGSGNLSPVSADHLKTVQERRDALTKANPDARGPIPADALSASSSGLDPHISPEYAAWQTPRVAKARGMSEADVAAVVARHTQGRTLGFLGQPRVNVTELNADLAGSARG
ncbi:potassium-transporting ATPase subunit KdpC [Mobilicoccus pelagius]|uniref:Potassium-transporting ATPase KdpC subunit n=1 Tax=Mobilicoccus pelagius NBRC 104925 TaxID=1089455 RepID=H5UVE8_9MICO|nr:potassium-transporting ATPase subunit KdpC [Mobilicoccus pelagius]GAB49706.1 potassium-transporting ATPase C chain [Mobilicoccus pelagius NBRC 104925]